jgi:hypothetical protein
MAFTDLRAVMRANLPEPPARACSRSARVRAASPALRAVGYDVLEPESDDVRAVALADLDEFAVGALTPLPLRGGSSSAARARRTAAADRRGARRGAPLAPAPVRADPRGTPASLRARPRPAATRRLAAPLELGESLRAVEEEAIARGHLRALAGAPASLRL